MQRSITTPLLSSEQPELDSCEKVISYACIDVAKPFRFFCSDGMNRQFEDKISKKDKNIVIEQSTIAFRADTRGPGREEDNIFEKGFSVYSAKRLVKKTFCDAPFVCGLSWLCCFPVSFLGSLASYLPNCSSGDALFGAKASLGDCFGQNRYWFLYATGNGALALAKEYSNAVGYFADTDNYWRYIIHLPNGYIDFTEFCEDLVRRGERERPSARDSATNIGEIIPNGRQKVPGHWIIAAVKSNEIRLNEHFAFYDKLKPFITGMTTTDQMASTTKDLNELLQEIERWHSTEMTSQANDCTEKPFANASRHHMPRI